MPTICRWSCSTRLDEARSVGNQGQDVSFFKGSYLLIKGKQRADQILQLSFFSMLPWDASGSGMGKPFPLPDAVTILEPKEEAPVHAPTSESRNVAAAQIGGAPTGGQQDIPQHALQAENPNQAY